MNNKNKKSDDLKSVIPGADGFSWPTDPLKMFGALIGNAEVLMVLLDEQNRLLMANKKVCEFIGTSENLYGKKLIDTLPPDIAKEVEASLETARKDGYIYQVENGFTHRGKNVWFSGSAVALPAPDGKGKWIFVVARDITEDAIERLSLREAKERLEFISENAGDAILLMDANSHIVWANKASEEISGYSFEEQKNAKRGWEEFFHPEDRDRMMKIHADVKTSEKKASFRFTHKNGAIKFFESVRRSVFDKSGQLKGYVIVARDLTNLREVEERYRLLAENALDMISIADTSFRLTYASASVKTIMGYEPEEFVGIQILQLFPKEDKAGFKLILESLLSGEKTTMSFQHPLICKDGSIKWFESNIKVITDSENRPVQFINYSRDITERRKIAEAMIQNQKNIAATTLAAGIAHEFNNLNAIILSHASFLKKEANLDQQGVEDVHTIIEAAERSAAITKQLITYAGDGKPHTTKDDLNDVVENLIKIVRDEYSTLGITITTDLDPRLPKTYFNRGQIQQVLAHIMTNAQHAVLNSSEKKIFIQTGTLDDRVFLSVRDSGIGIPPENIRRIFDPFFTTKGALGGNVVPGSGLGLPVCQSIIQKHGGSIVVESALNTGTILTVYLPIIKKPEQTKIASEYTDLTSVQTGVADVLIVDDEIAIGKMLKRLLQAIGYSVTVCNEGAAALESLKRQKYDLILLDLQIPDISGEKIAEYVSSLPSDRRPTCVIISGKTDADLEFLQKLGVTEFFEKPFDLDALTRRIKELTKPLKK